MSNTDYHDGTEPPVEPDEHDDHGDDEFEPVQVFPESEDMDLRQGADQCTKVGSCDAECPVAEVDDDFPGPQFQGPEQWRLTTGDGEDQFDDSVMSCSNCMRCDNACPSGVPFSQMHNTARGRYVSKMGFSLRKLRNRLLANYRTSAWLASKVPRLANLATNFGPARWLGEKVLGISKEREFPAFATETFREWWAARGGAETSRINAEAARERRGLSPDAEKRIAYFHGCYGNYNTPEVAKALVAVYEELGYEIVVPEQGCSGTPMFANGFLGDARRHAETNVANLGEAIEEGYDVIASCSSCSMALRQEYPEQFGIDGIADLAAHTYDALEYLRIHEDLETMLADASVEEVPDFAYHAPCHSRNQGLARQSLELFEALDGVEVTDVGDSCSGISGTYGWKAEKYETSMEIGEEMFEHMEEAPAEQGLTECPTCSMQMEHGTGYDVTHPLEILEAALVEV